MPTLRTYQKSFAGGEVTPQMSARFDDTKTQTGLKTCKNFIILPHGPATYRPGFIFISEVKDSAQPVRIIPFTFSSEDTAIVELGAGYARFYVAGAPVMTPAASAWASGTAYVTGDLVSRSGTVYYAVQGSVAQDPIGHAAYWYAMGTRYEIPLPFIAANLFEITYTQSFDVVTFAHRGYAPIELRRYANTNWQLKTISFGADTPPSYTAPTLSATRGSPASSVTRAYRYEYSLATAQDGSNESLSSPSAAAVNNLDDNGAYNTVTCALPAVAAVDTRVNVYRQQGGLYGFIGTVLAPAGSYSGVFTDDGTIIPDIATTPPRENAPFSTPGNYPGAVCYYEQRRVLGGTTNKQQTFWGTAAGTESNMNYSIPLKETDSYSYRVAAREYSEIRHLTPLTSLLILTSSAEYRATSSGDSITTQSISLTSQSSIGAGYARPVVVGANAVFTAARGGHVHALGFDWQSQAFSTADLSLRAPHLFDGKTIVDLALQKAPRQVVWAVSSDGRLLGLTFVPEQEVLGWHQHTTDGAFESIATAPLSGEDRIFVVVRRTINGVAKRYVEVSAPVYYPSVADGVFVDCAYTYAGVATNTITTGLAHVDGKVVSILADGAIQPPQTVTGGGLPAPLEYAAQKIVIGLPVAGEVALLPFGALDIPGAGSGHPKAVTKVFLRVNDTRSVWAGDSVSDLVEYNPRHDEVYGTPPTLYSGEIEIAIRHGWTSDTSVVIAHSDPLPMTLLSVSAEVNVGG